MRHGRINLVLRGNGFSFFTPVVILSRIYLALYRTFENFFLDRLIVYI